MIADVHGHVDTDYQYTDHMVSNCDSDGWYVRFTVENASDIESDFKEHLAGEKPTTGWGGSNQHWELTSGSTEIEVFAREPNNSEVSMGYSQSPPASNNIANTGNQYSGSHRMAWNIYTQTSISGDMASYYMLDNTYHNINNIPNGYSEQGTWKMCIWVR